MTQDPPGTWTANVSESWLQGRSVFGGLQTAIALRAMRTLVPAALPLRVLQTTFVAPVPAGRVTVRPQVLRTGKNVTQLEARIQDGGNTAAIVIGVFGNSRASRVRVVPEQHPVSAPAPLELSYVEGLTPNFVQHFTGRWLRGGLPFTGSTEREAVVEVGMREDGHMEIEHVAAIVDFIPPVALSMLDAFAPGSSLTWTLEMLTESVSGLPLRGFRIDAEVVAGGDGYTSQSVMVWGPGGEPIALSRQSMVVFG